jgi:hypothetical protein
MTGVSPARSFVGFGMRKFRVVLDVTKAGKVGAAASRGERSGAIFTISLPLPADVTA